MEIMKRLNLISRISYEYSLFTSKFIVNYSAYISKLMSSQRVNDFVMYCCHRQ